MGGLHMGKSKSNLPYSMIGTPEPNTGVRELSIREVAQIMMSNPKAREAVERINNFEKSPRMMEKIIHEDRSKNIQHIRNEKSRLDAAARKADMKRRGVVE